MKYLKTYNEAIDLSGSNNGYIIIFTSDNDRKYYYDGYDIDKGGSGWTSCIIKPATKFISFITQTKEYRDDPDYSFEEDDNEIRIENYYTVCVLETKEGSGTLIALNDICDLKPIIFETKQEANIKITELQLNHHLGGYHEIYGFVKYLNYEKDPEVIIDI